MRPSPSLLLLSATTITALNFPTLFPKTTPHHQTPLLPKMALYISDVLPRTRSINIFAGLTRDIDPISDRLDSATQYSIVLAPLNSAIQALDRKPWEDEEQIKAFGGSEAGAYGLGDGERRADDNLRRFVERHIVPLSPWLENDKVQTLAGDVVWWEYQDEDTKVVMPAGVRVGSVPSKVRNGEVWVLEGVLRKE